MRRWIGRDEISTTFKPLIEEDRFPKYGKNIIKARIKHIRINGRIPVKNNFIEN